MVRGAWRLLELLEADGIEAGIVSPWLRGVDGAWIAEVADGAPVFCLDNHYLTGGQGDAVVAALAAEAPDAASASISSASRRCRAAARITRSCGRAGSTARASPRPQPGSRPYRRFEGRRRCLDGEQVRAELPSRHERRPDPLLGHRRDAADHQTGRRVRARGGSARGRRHPPTSRSSRPRGSPTMRSRCSRSTSAAAPSRPRPRVPSYGRTSAICRTGSACAAARCRA